MPTNGSTPKDTAPGAKRFLRVWLRVLDKVTRPPALTLFALIQAIGLLGVALHYHLTLAGPLNGGGQVGTGDFLAFYTGARMIDSGAGETLYDFASQRAVQDEIVGAPTSGWQPYVNPPLLAIGLAAFADAGFLNAYRLFTAFMVGCGILGAWLIVRGCANAARGAWAAWAVVLLVLGFHPLFRTMAGGQNTALTWVLLTGIFVALQAERPIVAGLLLGLLSYKPQFVPLIGLTLLLYRQWTAIAVAAATAGAHYLLGAIEIGFAWPLQMLEMLQRYRELELGQNAAMHISLPAFFQNIAPPPIGTALGLGAVVASLALLVRFAPKAGPKHPDFGIVWALIVLVTMLVSPHLQFYDFGLVTLPVVLAIDASLRKQVGLSLGLRLTLALGYVLYPIVAASAGMLGFQPLTVMLVLTFAWILHLGSTSSDARAGAGDARSA